MRKDSEKFLEILLKMRAEQDTDHFVTKISDFKDIPNISTNCSEILKDLIRNNCISERSNLNIIGEMKIYLTLDGIDYFNDKKKEKMDNLKAGVTINVNDNAQVNWAQENGVIYATQFSSIPKKDYTTSQKKDKPFEINKKDTEVKKKKVFISYSWVPESNKAWVINLANRLERDGVEVVVDYKDLKLGHDIYSFMQRTVNDDTIDKVLIICNSEYKYKADNRKGGVGDESAIITSQVYGNVTQEKFIPVVNEKNEEGKPFLPNYLVSRLYADLTDFENGYRVLLENISGEENELKVNKRMNKNNDISDNGYSDVFQNSEITEDQKKAASLLYHDIKSIERYLAHERSSVNIRYSDDWQKMIENCFYLEEKYIDYIYSIYDEVYNYNYSYKHGQKHGLAFRKEDISSYKKLQNMIFDNTKGYVDFSKYNQNYKSLMNKLKLLKND